ncbi:topoisomerase I binding, arginine/serine-rich a [Periophthalmus magnuspinnatus]|uniref:topoisomerase I binding, arginine/serine-rich a n=1 Tax=Periophthalmus magnuspinnatus TaxID=409849 RepID=UPI00145B2EDF|nr:topoisomerase I binding, arginine/serine-rich a [Periophthalmus magnuspinnatus]
MGKSEIMSAIKIALQHNQSRAKRKSGEMSTEVSPDSKCPICLDMFNNISYLDLCLHKFCFRCIHEWSKNKAECPLCKQPFNSIYHSIKSEQDFKKFDLKPADNGSFGTFGGVRFRYRTTLTGVNRHMQRTIAPPENGVMFETTNPPPQRQDRYIRRIMTKLAAQRRAASEGRSVNTLREQEMINFRKELYRQGVRVRGVRDGGRSRDTSAEFYRRNPACLHRLVPWLKRELMVVYGAHGSLVNIVQHIVMSRITRYDVEDGAMLEELRPFLQGCTEHFLHEFISFAKSPFNMEAYDQHAVYDYQGPSSTDENSSNSSVIALSEDETQSVELDPPGDSNSTNMSHSMWDDETPGPSYSTQSEPSRVEQLSLPHSDSDSSVEEGRGFQAPVETVTRLNQKEETPQNELFSSDSEDCVIVGFVKPTAERTPELVQLSSDSSDDEDNKENPSLRQHIRFTSVSPAVSLSSGPVDDGPSEGANIPQPNVKERHKTSSLTSQRMHTPEKRSKEAHKDARISKYRAQRMKRRSRSRDRRTPEKSYSRDRGHSHSAYYSYYKRRDSHSTYTHSSHSGSHHYYDRDGWHSRYTRSRSRSRERRRDRGRSKSYSSSRSPSVKIKSHHDKPGGKRKYKTRHLEEPYNNTTKRDLSKHRKKSKDKGQDVELHSENSPERSRRHRKKKKKHKKKSKRHKSSDPKEKTVLNIISVDSDNCADGTQDNSTNNSPSKTSPVPTLPDTEAVLC